MNFQPGRWVVGVSTCACVFSLLMLVPQAAWAGSAGQWVLQEAGTTCFNLLVDEPVEGPRITSVREPLQEASAERDVVYALAGGSGGLAVGSRVEVVRNTGVLNPIVGTGGSILEILGVAEVVDTNEQTALLRIESSCRELEIGDVLRPLGDEDTPLDLPRMPVFDADILVSSADSDAFLVMGALESVRSDGDDLERVSMIQYQIYGQRDLMVIDQGSGSAWQAADVALIYRDGSAASDAFRTALETPAVIGRGVVVRSDASSAVLQVVDSVSEIELGDRARNMGSIWDFVNRPPSITCRAERDEVRFGESVRLIAEVTDPDGDATTISWEASAGTLTPSEGSTVTYTAEDVTEGVVTVVATANDGGEDGRVDCNLTLAAVPPTSAAAPGGVAMAPTDPESDVLEFTCPEYPNGVTDADNRCKAVLDDVALLMRRDPRATAQITGHTDSAGDAAANQTRSEERADKARQYLVETHGIDASRIATEGVGASRPIGDNETPEGRLTNRRVEIRVTVPGGGAGR